MKDLNKETMKDRIKNEQNCDSLLKANYVHIQNYYNQITKNQNKSFAICESMALKDNYTAHDNRDKNKNELIELIFGEIEKYHNELQQVPKYNGLKEIYGLINAYIEIEDKQEYYVLKEKNYKEMQKDLFRCIAEEVIIIQHCVSVNSERQKKYKRKTKALVPRLPRRTLSEL
uniref:Uncharacterized protein n=2 Tax=Meloidogyne TaxID=189290 RepID=A0A6V7WUL4_MELEN|nr:unnamed protein product [Meloidogyne enterolobii]